jgi:Spy/CpxP family protein refolding chaperone
MTRNGLKLLLAASLLLNLSVLATAGYLRLAGRGSWVSPFGTKMAAGRFLFEELSLTPEQSRAMREKAIPFRAEIDRQRGEIVNQRKELIELLRADIPDAAAIDAVISRISGMQETMQKEITSHMLEEKALLDHAQQKRFLDLIEHAMTQGRQAGCPPDAHE